MPILPAVAAIVIKNDCSPMFSKLEIIFSFVPTESPKKNSKTNIVRSVNFPTKRVIFLLAVKRPIIIPITSKTIPTTITQLRFFIKISKHTRL